MSLTSLPPGSEIATDVTSQKVFINGEELSGEVLLQQITINKTFNKISSAKISFIDGSVSDRDFPLSNDDKFKPGSELEIQLGYHGEVETVFEGIIVKHGIKALHNRTSQLIIEAKDKAIKLTGTRKRAYHNDKTDSDIIEALAGELDKDIEATTFSHKQLVQYDCTDWDFLVTRAEANSLMVLTDDNKLIVKKPTTTSSAVLTATYGQNIWEFEAEMDARAQFQEVKSQAWDYTSQSLESSETGMAVFTETGNLSVDDLGSVIGASVTLNHGGHLTQPQLQNWSDAYAMRNFLSKAAGRVKVDGNALLKPGTIITLDGVGDRFNGNVFVTGVLHHYNGTWVSDVQFGWREEWFYKKDDVMPKPASGLMPGINGLQIGIVKDVDDQDEGQYRVKVHVPTVNESDEGIWARVATLDAGNNRGTYFRPVEKDEVVLGFLNDDPREAIILGYLHSKDKNPSPLPEDDGALQFGLVTKEGLKLIFDDTNKRLTVLVPSGSGQKSIVLNNDSSALEIKDENKNTIKMESSGITIESGSGNVTIKGVQVLIN